MRNHQKHSHCGTLEEREKKNEEESLLKGIMAPTPPPILRKEMNIWVCDT